MEDDSSFQCILIPSSCVTRQMRKCKRASEGFPVIHHTDYSLFKNDHGVPFPLASGTNVLEQGSANMDGFDDRRCDNIWEGMPKKPELVPFEVRRMKSDTSCLSDISLSPKSTTPTISNIKMSDTNPSSPSDHSLSKCIEENCGLVQFALLPSFNSMPPRDVR